MDKFWNMYKSGSIVFPDAVSRYFSASMGEAYEICEIKKEEGVLKQLYMIQCPHCFRIANQERYYTVRDINTDVETGCVYCDYEFIPKLNRDVMILYEKI